MRRIFALFALAGVPLALTGCGALLYGSGVPEVMTTRSVPPEYSGLPGHKLAVVVRTLEQTDWEHPELPGDLERFVLNRFKQDLGKVTLVSQAEVQRYKDQHQRWTDTPEVEVGRKFKADMVLYINVDFYSPSQSDPMHYMQGKLTCRCLLYDCASGERLWEKPDLTVQFPPKSMSGGITTSPQKNKTQLMMTFSEKLTQCFYRHWESDNE
ncbi:MAG: hypothetical protein PHU85_19590 [Phycisphaerae bacterium]|nr:hypothetical protein [Phycisphaerae bacterium]